ncbi:MAG: Fe-S-containing protein [Acidobacteria bacterium]|nr:Fe-S-containing protein [Acidobacteriota bacterium]
MFEALVVTLREGVEAALVVGIILAYLKKTGREMLARFVFQGLGAGLAASVVCAVLFSRLGISEEAYEGWLMLLGSLFVASMVYWMWRTAKGLKREIEQKVEAITSRPSGAVAAGLFLLTFLLILREGVETVLFLGAIQLTTDSLLAWLGGTLGLVLALLFGIAFVRGTVRVDLGRFFRVTEIVLLLLAAQLFIGGLHEFGELGSLPVGREEMRLIGPIVKNDVLIIVSLLALPLIILLVPGREEKSKRKAAEGLEGPQRRLALASLRRETLWRRLFAVAGTVIIASLTVSYAFSRLPRGIDPPSLLAEGEGGEVRLAKAGLEDGHLHRFGVSLDGVIVRFIVIETDDKLVPAFDACQVCGASGYVEMKGRLVCLACAADINRVTLGMGGGCNPIPLPYRDEGSDLVMSVSDLKARLEMFRSTPAIVSPPTIN